ncbi:hypothetical protein [Culturomica massiliensis]|jgi:cytochrome b|uniref:hypothetical protein n=1 Tax=Culturomica massiliensis TaxID=1841857 RepID=UPI0003360D79|nr:MULTISPECIES: hypothetical protein [Odoribacteraceae]RHV93213.1 hypothetical protein DXA95_10790 [Odoribacter sp. OF09-27XD]CCZ07736.1 putative uncharacterized protein [Odoribacter sp. CAG:788]
MARMFERKDTRKFDLKPRYWDPEKEEREEREKRIKAELGIREDDKDAYIPNIKGHFTELYKQRKAQRKGHNGQYAVRLFMVLIIIFLAALFIMMRYSEGVLKFLGM